jgi:hypothetical protein
LEKLILVVAWEVRDKPEDLFAGNLQLDLTRLNLKKGKKKPEIES